MNILDIAIAKKLAGGGGGSGTDNYNDLSNLPKINDTTLSGNKSSSALGLQSEINSDSKLASDLVDDTNQDNKFVTSTEKNTWNAKQNAIDNSHKLSSDLVDDTNHTNKFVTSTEKNTWNAKQNAIDADHKLSSSLVSFSTAEAAALASGIDSSKVGQISTNQTNIWYVLGKTGKNFLDCSLDRLKAVNNEGTWNGNVYTVASVGTVTINSDKTITVVKTGTSARLVFYLSSNQEAAAISGDKFAGYILSGCPSGGSSTTYRLTGEEISSPWSTVSNDYGNGDTIQSSTLQVGFYISIHADYTTTGSGLTFKPMICTEEDWNVSPDHQPYRGLPNYDLTELEAEDRAALAEQVDEGAKNVVDTYDLDAIKALNTTGVWNGNVYTHWGITYTFNGDGTITVNRILARDAVSQLNLYALTASEGRTLSLDTGDYYVCGGKSDTKFLRVIIVNGSETVNEYNCVGDTLITTQTGYNIYVSLRIAASESPSNEILKIMICTKAKYDISPNYEPHALPNTDLTRMVNDLQKKAVKVYTYHVNPNESDPEDAVTYLDDATGLTPAKMGASSFSYGSWANAWFLPRPCMLKSDGTVAYYLNPNDYSKKTDGAASDIADANFDGNVMLEFPKIWVKRVNDGNGARTVSIAPVNVDGTYKCWSNINAEDKEVDHFYLPAYNGTIHSSKMRSLSGVTLNATYAPNYTRAQEVTAATANNPTGKNLWYTETWADFCLIYDLLYLMGKSLDVQRTFGQGLSGGEETAMRAYVTGSLNDKGLFYGDISAQATGVKVLGMENLWGCRWHGVAGLIDDNGTLKVKMTYGVADGSTTVGYNTTGSGYLNYGSTYGTDGFVKKMQADNTMGYKIIETAGTDATYYCDYYYVSNSISAYALLGGRSGSGAYCGFSVDLAAAAADAYWFVGGSLSCRPES